MSEKKIGENDVYVYTDVYDYRKSDLVNKTIANLPDVIDIEELKVQGYRHRIDK